MKALVRFRLTLLVTALVVATSLTYAQQSTVGTANPAAVPTTPLSAAVPVDPQITVGTLPNGLRYYIRVNRQPRNRAELRLAVNAGSVLEDDNQRGLAHMVEHMSFNGTEHFPGQNVVAFLQALGMRFGAHVNAHTGFDETVYQLQVPTDTPQVLDRAMLVMEDWAHAVTFDPVEVDKERGVVQEEWRLGLGAAARMQDAQFPVLLRGSRYGDRLPIGKPEIIRNFSIDVLKKFYADWYRPDLMAVIAVGDFDPRAVETLITSHFSNIPKAASPRPRPVYNVPDHTETLYAIATDPEATGTTVSVNSTMAAREQVSVGAYRQSVVERLFSGMLSARFDEISQKPDAPFLAAGTSRGRFVNSTEMTSLNALVTGDGIERGLTSMFSETARVARFGFTQTELDRQKATVEQFYERAITERAAQESASLADEYIRNFIETEPIPGIAYEYALHRRFLPEITLAEINALAKDWMPNRNRVVMVSAPRTPGVTVPDETKLAAAITAAGDGPSTAYVDEVANRPLLDKLPPRGRITKRVANDAFGITEWTLSNGVRVVLKPTMFKQDQILFRAVSPGGTSLASDQDFVPAMTADEVIPAGGLGPFSRATLDKLLAGKNAVVSPDIGETQEGLRGAASRRDLETMFQLVYLTFTQPRADAEAFQAMKGQMVAALANRAALPETAFRDTLQAALTQNHLRAQPFSADLVAKMDLQKSLAFYKDRFADASDFTFVFVGSFDEKLMQPLVERYLASLPATHRREMPKDVGIRPPAGVVERQVVKGVDPKSEVTVVFTGTFINSQQNRVVMRAMAETLEGDLQRLLREDLGGTYGVSVRAGFDKQPQERYTVTIDFSCDPARTDELVKALFSSIDRFRRAGPTAGQVIDERSALVRDLETSSRDNGYLLNQLTFKYAYDENVADVFDMRTFYDVLTPNMLRNAAQTYLDPTRFVKVTLMPETATK
jgi:zinc protease